jgi:hypothetical protein
MENKNKTYKYKYKVGKQPKHFMYTSSADPRENNGSGGFLKLKGNTFEIVQ